MVLAISKQTLLFLARLAEQEYPHESCAVLLGRDPGQVNVAVKCANVHPEPQRHYAIDSRELIRVQRSGRSFGLQIVGFHHSHPDHEAMWSETDLAEANWVGCVYVISSVARGLVQSTRAYQLRAEEKQSYFREMLMEVE